MLIEKSFEISFDLSCIFSIIFNEFNYKFMKEMNPAFSRASFRCLISPFANDSDDQPTVSLFYSVSSAIPFSRIFFFFKKSSSPH